MTSKSKSIAILLCTLVLGMAMGALLFGAVQRHRLGPAMRLVRPQHMIGSIEHVVRPADEEQRQAIREVVGDVVEEMGQMRLEVWTQMRSQMDSLEERLKPVLSEEQQERLSAHLDDPRKLAGQRWRREMGPGGMGPGRMRPGAMGPGFPPKGDEFYPGWWQAEGALAELGLSAEQRSELQTLLEKHRLDMRGVRARAESPPVAEMQTLRARRQVEVERILTPEQRARLEEMKRARPRWGEPRRGPPRERSPEAADTGSDE